MRHTGIGQFYLNKYKPGLQGGDSTATPAMTLRHPGTPQYPSLYGNDPEQLGTEPSFIFTGGRENTSSWGVSLHEWVRGEAFQLTAAAAKDAEGDTVGYQWSASLVKGQFDDKADRAQMPLRKLEKKDPPTTSEGCVCGLMERQREGFSLHLFPYLSMLVQSTKAKPHAAAMTTGRW